MITVDNSYDIPILTFPSQNHIGFTLSYLTALSFRAMNKQVIKYINWLPEMEKRADASVLFFSSAVLIFWLYTRKLDKNTLLKAMY